MVEGKGKTGPATSAATPIRAASILNPGSGQRRLPNPQKLVDILRAPADVLAASRPFTPSIWIGTLDGGEVEQNELADEMRKQFERAGWQTNGQNTPSGESPFSGVKLTFYAEPQNPELHAKFHACKNALRDAIDLLGDATHVVENDCNDGTFGSIVVGRSKPASERQAPAPPNSQARPSVQDRVAGAWAWTHKNAVPIGAVTGVGLLIVTAVGIFVVHRDATRPIARDPVAPTPVASTTAPSPVAPTQSEMSDAPKRTERTSTSSGPTTAPITTLLPLPAPSTPTTDPGPLFSAPTARADGSAHGF
jgi:hypothetical protein